MSDPRIIPATAGVAFEDGPDRGRILVAAGDTAGRYALMEWTVAPGAAQPPGYGPHLHREMEETFHVRSGRLDFLLGQTVTTLGPGDFVRVPPGARHGYANLSGAPVDLLVGFYPGGFEALFLKHRTDQPQAPESDFVTDATELFASEFEAE